MLLADHQVLSSTDVLVDISAIVLAVWIVVISAFLLTRRPDHIRTALESAAATTGVVALVIATALAFVPINVDSGYRHCGTALIPEPVHSCTWSDVAPARIALVGSSTALAIALAVAIYVRTRAPSQSVGRSSR